MRGKQIWRAGFLMTLSLSSFGTRGAAPNGGGNILLDPATGTLCLFGTPSDDQFEVRRRGQRVEVRVRLGEKLELSENFDRKAVRRIFWDGLGGQDVFDDRSRLPVLHFLIDSSRRPRARLFPPLGDQLPRPLVRIDHDAGGQASFVGSEITLVTGNLDLLADLFHRRNAVVLWSEPAESDPGQGGGNQTFAFLLRVTVPETPFAELARRVWELDPEASGEYRASSQAGFDLLGLVLEEMLLGLPVGLNGVFLGAGSADLVRLGGYDLPESGQQPALLEDLPRALAPIPLDPSIFGILRLEPLYPFFPRDPVPGRGESMIVGTLNAQFLPGIPGSFSGCCEDLEDREEKLAGRIQAGGYDVIALNEVFREDSKFALAGLLSADYPYFVEFIDGNGFHLTVREHIVLPVEYCHLLPPSLIRTCQDSGLMLFSKFPFVELPSATPYRHGAVRARAAGLPFRDVAYTEFLFCTNGKQDCFANKGAALVRVSHPVTGRIYNLVFSHIQAAQGKLERDVRTKQFGQVQAMIEDILPPARLGSENLLLMGDMNVQGDYQAAEIPEWECPFGIAPGPREEWSCRFGPDSPSIFATQIRETWEFETQSSSVPLNRRDPGLTTSVDQTDYNRRHRVDYIFRNRAIEPTTNRPLCFQHLTLAHNLAWSDPGNPEAFSEGGLGQAGVLDLSDHYGLNADINLWAPHCSSGEARFVHPDEFDDFTGTALFTTSVVEEFRLTHPGSMQWFLLPEAGTYSFALYDEAGRPGEENGLKIRAYQSYNLSVPLVDHLGETTPFFDAAGQGHTGRKFHFSEGPIYVRVSADDRLRTGRYTLAIHRHRCTSPEDSCPLDANRELPQEFEVPHDAIGWDGTLWFEVDTDAPLNDTPQELEFRARPLGEIPPGYRLELLRADDGSLLATTGDRGIGLNRSDPSDNRSKLYLRVLLGSPRPTRIQAGWSTNLMVLHDLLGIWELKLRCKKQADRPDLLGVDDDNVRLQVVTDFSSLFFESEPGVEPRIDERPNTGNFDTGTSRGIADHLPCPVGYLDFLNVVLQEQDAGRRGEDDTLVGRNEDFLLPRDRESLLGASAPIRGTGRKPGVYQFNYNLSHSTLGQARDAARFEIGPDGILRSVCSTRSRP